MKLSEATTSELFERIAQLEAQLEAHEQGVGWEVFREDFRQLEAENERLLEAYIRAYNTGNFEYMDALLKGGE